MSESDRTSYREIFLNQPLTPQIREITLPSVSSGAIHHDTRGLAGRSERGGGYSYTDSSNVRSPCHNRFIYWRILQDVLELCEVCLDFNLTSNTLRIRFQDGPLIGSASFIEDTSHIVIIATTSSTIHRLIFPHPNHLQQNDMAYLLGADSSLTSIFTDASIGRCQDPQNNFCINQSGHSYTAITSSASMNSKAYIVVAMATTNGGIVLVRLPKYGTNGSVSQQELRCSSVMQRLWTGLVPAAIRGGDSEADICRSLLFLMTGPHLYLYSIHHDLKLRMWSAETGECVMVCDMMCHVAGMDQLTSSQLSSPGCCHLLRQCYTDTSTQLAVYLSLGNQSQFCVFEVEKSERRYQLNHMITIHCPQDELVDYQLMPGLLWGLWQGKHGEQQACVAHTAPLADRSVETWIPASMVSAEPPQLAPPSHLDARLFYMEQIFSPGRFSTFAIVKALNLYVRSIETTHMPDANFPLSALKLEVSNALQNEIANELSQHNMGSDERVRVEGEQWARFYSYLVQYQYRVTRSLGMMSDTNTGMVAIIKKESMSYLRPSQITEHLYDTPRGVCLPQDIQHQAGLAEEGQLCGDLVCLAECLRLMHEALSAANHLSEFNIGLYHMEDPVDLAKTAVTRLIADPNSRDMLMDICDLAVAPIGDLLLAIETLVSFLDLPSHTDMPASMDFSEYGDAGVTVSSQRLFSSADVGIPILCQSVQQLASTRLHLSTDLLMFLSLVTHMGEQVHVSLATAERMRSDLMQRTATLVQSYQLLAWCCRVEASYVNSQQVENSLRQKEALGLQQDNVSSLVQKDGQGMTALELFLRTKGGVKVRREVMPRGGEEEEGWSMWKDVVMAMTLSTAHMLWPHGSFCFPEFLASQCQFIALQDYVRLAQCCEGNLASRRFLLALAYLNCNESDKAVECVLEAMHGVEPITEEDFLVTMLPDDISPESRTVCFFLKVISLFEQCSLPQQVLHLARTAIDISPADDPNIATFWSKVFINELELGHNEEAYTAMLANPDTTRRGDCLRQLIVVLCERKQIQTLIELPYRDGRRVLEDDVLEILQSRARSIDLTQHNYYDLLYAFCMERSNYRKAGRYMYEHGMRLGREVSGLKSLQKQAKCYLAAINALRLVDPKNAWIIKPLSSGSELEDDESDTGKRSLDSEEIRIPLKKKVAVIEVSDIEREYMLLQARLHLLQHDRHSSYSTGPTLGAEETVALLVQAGLMDRAIHISLMFDLSLTPVFDGLTSRCVRLADSCDDYMIGDNEVTSHAWQWLEHNQLPTANATRDASCGEHAWRLLREYLHRYGVGHSRYHKCITTRLLSEGFPLPDWLVQAYKRDNAAELLRLYLDYDLLEEATHLTIDYIQAVLGCGKEHFGLDSYVHCGSPPVWLPYNTIDQLILSLQQVTSEPYCTKLYQELCTSLDDYFGSVESVSQDVMKRVRMLAV